MKILVVDNFDSFTYNLVHYLEGLDCDVKVVRNTEIDYTEVSFFDKIVLSPGPKLPKDSPKLMRFIAEFYDKKPFLGVCLGMQALAEFFGDKLYNLNQVKHGVSEAITILNKESLFSSFPDKIEVALYHSWAVELNENSSFIPLAVSESNVLMSIEHKKLPLYGVQFHPESILTPEGKRIIANFLT